jgi:hypothetical protein
MRSMATWRRPLWVSLPAAVLALGVAARPAPAQQEPWSPAPPPAAEPPPSEGGGVGLQLLAGVGIGAAVVTTLVLAAPDGRAGEYVAYGAAAVTPAGVGLAVCNLGRRSERKEPSCPRAVIAAYIGSAIALPVFLAVFMLRLDWGPREEGAAGDAEENADEAVIIAATAVAWVAGMTAGATIFGRRRIRPPLYAPPPPPPPWPTGFAPGGDPRQPRWAIGRSPDQLVFRLLSVAF